MCVCVMYAELGMGDTTNKICSTYIEVMVLEVHLKAKQTAINNMHHCGMPAIRFQA